ncbi:hypothetical protein C6356_07925 [Bacillus wiedmannii]|uniref:hypothetical protein n=1 Tax=Bacillus wiedmannii TaxID=1890302 RepID=UPI000D095F4E|nr:hypothetical protein [Bacillus wiedmannii]PRT08272.1 hypothetical protein C6356_07925 [Bacillus wiedmannii]
MILKEKSLSINEIMLDPFNPRFSESPSTEQEKIQKKLMELSSTKELLNSMKSGITWVNKIVVRTIDSYSINQSKKLGEDLTDFSYVAVEGNTRLACLKDEKMDDFINRRHQIPVIEAIKEDDETQEQFERAIRRLQGIANVMVVKDWEAIPKAKHIYHLYMDKRNQNSDVSNTQIFKRISEELGLKPGDVKGAVYRYIFYKEISENSDPIDKDDWKFLEVFEQNETVRKVFGWDNNISSFEWSEDSEQGNLLSSFDENTSLIKQELLYMFPEIIESAKRENINSKKLRDTFRDIIASEVTTENLFNDMKETVRHDNDEYAYNNWKKKYFQQQEHLNSETEWKNNLEKMVNWLKQYPINEDWSSNQIEQLKEIKVKVERLITISSL